MKMGIQSFDLFLYNLITLTTLQQNGFVSYKFSFFIFIISSQVIKMGLFCEIQFIATSIVVNIIIIVISVFVHIISLYISWADEGVCRPQNRLARFHSLYF